MKKRKYTSHPCSEETKKKLRDRIITPEWKEKHRKGLLGHRVSEETKRKISESHKGKKHSIKTRKKMSEVSSGEKNPNWKGGVTKLNNNIRGRREIRWWKKAVYKKDNWTCQKYGINIYKLHAHHIQNFADFPELRFNIDNGITLSSKAHKEFHKKYGIKNNTREQLLEFLK